MRAIVPSPTFVASFQSTLLEMAPLIEPTFDASFIPASCRAFEQEFQEVATFAARLGRPEIQTNAEEVYRQRLTRFAGQLESLGDINRTLQRRGLRFRVHDITALEGVFHAAAYDAIGDGNFRGFGSRVAGLFVDSLAAFCGWLPLPPSDLHDMRLSYRQFLDGQKLSEPLLNALQLDGRDTSFVPDTSSLDAEFGESGEAPDNELL